MKPEIKAKVEELLKKNEHHELTLDQLEQVAGGNYEVEYEGPILGPLGLENLDAYAALLQYMIDEHGMDYAIIFANKYIVPSNDNETWLQAGGVTYWYNEWHRRLTKDGNTTY